MALHSRLSTCGLSTQLFSKQLFTYTTQHLQWHLTLASCVHFAPLLFQSGVPSVQQFEAVYRVSTLSLSSPFGSCLHEVAATLTAAVCIYYACAFLCVKADSAGVQLLSASGNAFMLKTVFRV